MTESGLPSEGYLSGKKPVDSRVVNLQYGCNQTVSLPVSVEERASAWYASTEQG